MAATTAQQLIPISRAREIVLEGLQPLDPEGVLLSRAQGRTLAADVYAAEDLPPFASSAMDGFALAAGEAATLAVTGESRAGHPMPNALRAGEAARISTGAMIPDGADTVVPIEEAQDLQGSVRVPRTEPGSHIRLAGEDIRRGDGVIARGATLEAAELALLAAVGLAEVDCFARPRVSVLATGDELVDPGAPRGQAQIRNSNSVALQAQAREAGAEVVAVETVGDQRQATIDALERALSSADVVCISGGVSVGEHDHVKQALETLGVEPRFWGVRLKPGKPTWFGSRGRKLVYGLPGNPVSSMVCFHLFARPALRALGGAEPRGLVSQGVFDSSVDMHPAREQALRCRLRLAADGWHLEPTKDQGSHILGSMLDADALAFVPQGEATLAADSAVEFELLPRRYV